jgi:hypothetical protein
MYRRADLRLETRPFSYPSGNRRGTLACLLTPDLQTHTESGTLWGVLLSGRIDHGGFQKILTDRIAAQRMHSSGGASAHGALGAWGDTGPGRAACGREAVDVRTQGSARRGRSRWTVSTRPVIERPAHRWSVTRAGRRVEHSRTGGGPARHGDGCGGPWSSSSRGGSSTGVMAPVVPTPTRQDRHPVRRVVLVIADDALPTVEAGSRRLTRRDHREVR